MSYYVAQQPMYMPVQQQQQQPMMKLAPMELPVMAQQQQQYMQAPVQYVPMVQAAVEYKKPAPVKKQHTIEKKATVSNKSLHGGSKRCITNDDSIIIRDKMGRKYTFSALKLNGVSKRLEDGLNTAIITMRENVTVSSNQISNKSKAVIDNSRLAGGKIINDKYDREYLFNTHKIQKNSVKLPEENNYDSLISNKYKYGKTLLNTNKIQRQKVQYVPIVGGNVPNLGQPVYMAQPQTQSNLYYTPVQPAAPMFYAPRS